MEQLNYMKAEMRSGILKASFFMPRIQELPFTPAVIPYGISILYILKNI